MKKQLIPIVILLGLSCSQVSEKTKQAINKGGELAGQAATELVDGISDGIDSVTERNIVLTEELKEKIELGEHEVENKGGWNNQLAIYCIFKEDFSGELMAKAFNSEGKEIGRTTTRLNYSKSQADHIIFKFPERTSIEIKSKIEIEISK